MHFLYAIVRYFPYWALPLVLVTGEMGVHFRRKKSPIQYFCFFLAGLLVFGIGTFIFLRGDLYSDRWVRTFLE